MQRFVWVLLMFMAVQNDHAFAGRIELVLATEPGVSPTDIQQWYQLMTALRVDSLQIRGGMATDKLEIVTVVPGSDPSYRLTGMINGKNELLLPGGRFNRTDRAGISGWLTKLRNEGPARAMGAAPAPFGIPAEQMTPMRSQMARPVDFKTKGLGLRECIDRIAARLQLRLSTDRSATEAIARSEQVRDELEGLAGGTALAAALRPAGLIFTPRLDDTKNPDLLIAAPISVREFWPVGRPPTEEMPDGKLVPGMFEFVNVELDDVPVVQLLEAIGSRIKAPVLLDHNGLARSGIDLTQTKVSLAATKSTYSLVLSRQLYKAKVKHEIRIDDAGKPLLWIAPR